MLSTSSLSPPPKNLKSPPTATENKAPVKIEANSKKRKAETAVNAIKATKRTRKTTVRAGTDASVEGSADAPMMDSQPKKRARKAKVEEEIIETEVITQKDGDDTTANAKQKKTRKRKDAVVSRPRYIHEQRANCTLDPSACRTNNH